ncbi:MAG: aminofutalosine synthase MqnE [Nitrospirae bacterium]|nr:aminofutalosine synthase MqnE [Nitrospirota bacterium]MBF0535920.1 aminofutalosine synthase MqnE [Nitrospirota bacterium]MBF0617748.1 aminofutalosine synthase MqnE [Nitrospirota bacterium]
MISRIQEKVTTGVRLTPEDCLILFNSDDIFTIGQLADFKSKQIHFDKVYYSRNRHVNPTNLCVNRCKFCAFSRSAGETGGFEYTVADIIKMLQRTDEYFKELHIVGGLHPKWPFDYYVNLISQIKLNFPHVYIKAFTAVEIDYMSRLNGLGVEQTLKILKNSGLDMLPGGGAEIFSSSVRNALCPEKISASEWLHIHEKAHLLGIKSNATMLYGHIESFEDRVNHLSELRDLQDKTNGFFAFIPLSYQPNGRISGTRFPSAIDDLKTIAISRLFLDNFPHIKAYWIMLGEKLTQVALLFGANDIDGTVIQEKIAHSAGAVSAEKLSVSEIENLIKKAGKIPVERTALYEEVTV